MLAEISLGTHSHAVTVEESELIFQLIQRSASRLRVLHLQRFCHDLMECLIESPPSFSSLLSLEIWNFPGIEHLLARTKGHCPQLRELVIHQKYMQKKVSTTLWSVLPMDRLVSFSCPALELPEVWPSPCSITTLHVTAPEYCGPLNSSSHTAWSATLARLTSYFSSTFLALTCKLSSVRTLFAPDEWDEPSSTSETTLVETGLALPVSQNDLEKIFRRVEQEGIDLVKLWNCINISSKLVQPRIAVVVELPGFCHWTHRRILPKLLNRQFDIGKVFTEKVLEYVLAHKIPNEELSTAFGGFNLLTATLAETSNFEVIGFAVSDYVVDSFAVDVNQRLSDGMTALHFCLTTELVSKLASLGADPTIVALNGRSALDNACARSGDWIETATVFLNVFGPRPGLLGSHMYRAAVCMRLCRVLVSKSHPNIEAAPVFTLLSSLSLDELVDGFVSFLYLGDSPSKSLFACLNKILLFWEKTATETIRSADQEAESRFLLLRARLLFGKANIHLDSAPFVAELVRVAPWASVILA